MPEISRGQIENKIRQLLEQESKEIDELTLDDIVPLVSESAIDLLTLFNELGALKAEVRQMNRLENKRVESLKSFVQDEKAAKEQLLQDIGELATTNEILRSRSLILSIIQLRDFVESLHRAIPSLFQQNALYLFKQGGMKTKQFLLDNTAGILRKIDVLLESEQVYPIQSDAMTFDPELMTATGTASLASLPDGQVVETIEKGFIHQDKVVRYAKVIVNKISTIGVNS